MSINLKIQTVYDVLQANCQYPTTTAGHYFVAPGYQPYVSVFNSQGLACPVPNDFQFPQAAPVLMNHQAAQYAAATAAATAYTAYGVPDNYRPPLAVIGPVNSSMPLTPNSSSDNADGQLEELDSNQVEKKSKSVQFALSGRQDGFVINVFVAITRRQ